jgi:hypothetical protein
MHCIFYEPLRIAQKLNNVTGIGMDLRETGWKSTDWMHLVQDRDQWRDLVNTVMKLRVT